MVNFWLQIVQKAHSRMEYGTAQSLPICGPAILSIQSTYNARAHIAN